MLTKPEKLIFIGVGTIALVVVLFGAMVIRAGRDGDGAGGGDSAGGDSVNAARAAMQTQMLEKCERRRQRHPGFCRCIAREVPKRLTDEEVATIVEAQRRGDNKPPRGMTEKILSAAIRAGHACLRFRMLTR